MASTVEVGTRDGRIRGIEEAGIRIFRGVRYAASLDGERRFLPPVPVAPWSGTRDALKPGPAAPQFSVPVFGWINAAGVTTGEDCLSLNVWTPGTDAAKRPVMVWMHGGGFLVGSGSTGLYDGTHLARRGDVVVVTLNYRLGALGYAQLGSVLGAGFEESSNLGVRDQIAALEWVRDNIDRFGGDADNVTVFGQSAGAMSLGALLGAPRARALFKKAICMSGAADHVLEPEQAQQVAETFIRQLGKPRPGSPKAMAWYSMGRIMRAQRETMLRLMNLQKMMVFLPAVDGDLIPEQPLDAIRGGAAADIPLLIGTTLDEWRLFRVVEQGLRGIKEEALFERFDEALAAGYPGAPAPRTAIAELREALAARGAQTAPGDVWLEFQSQRMMHYPATRLAEAQHQGGGSAHSYLFSWRPPAMRRVLGAFHALDIPFVFGWVKHPLARPLTGFTESASRLSNRMQRSWLGFARDGDPTHDLLPRWEGYKPGLRPTMVFGRSCSLSAYPLEGERALLEKWIGEEEPVALDTLPVRAKTRARFGRFLGGRA